MAQTISLKIYLASTITFVIYWFIIKGALNVGGYFDCCGKMGDCTHYTVFLNLPFTLFYMFFSHSYNYCLI